MDHEDFPSTGENRLNRVLKVACGLLIFLVASQNILSLAGVPRYYQLVTTGAVPVMSLAGETWISNQYIAEWAAARGMTLQTYALYTIALNGFITLGFSSVAALILWKARQHWFHWFTALVLLFIPSGGLWEFSMVSRIAINYVAVGSLLWPAFLLFLFLFPNGRAVPRWAGSIVGALAAVHLVVQTVVLFAQLGIISDTQVSLVFQLFNIVLAALPLILISQVYRYVRVSNRTERVQTRWFVAGLVTWLGIDLLISVLAGGNTSATSPDAGFGGDITSLMMLTIPASIGISILRYRLYEIDVIIRRTLVYSLLTAVLAALYFGSVVVIQLIFRALSSTPEQPASAIVLSTLILAALFNPLRRNIQNFIDRRFYRRRYNSEQILHAFSGAVQNEVNLDQLSRQLLLAVDETMQPEQTSLWLRDVSRSDTKS